MTVLSQFITNWPYVAVGSGTATAPSMRLPGVGANSGIYSSDGVSVDLSTSGLRRLGVSGSGEVTVYGGNVDLRSQGSLRLFDSDSSNWVAIKAPANITNNATWTWPSADGTNGQALTTNGNGGLGWGGIAAGSGPDGVFLENGNTVTTSYTISAGKNAVSAGPITINPGAVVTVPSGSSWVIV